MSLDSYIFYTLASLLFGSAFILFLYTGILFYKEGEKMASHKSFLIALLIFLSGAFTLLFKLPIVLFGLSLIVVVFLILFFIPFSINTDLTDDYPLKRVDERDVIFSRRKLQPGSEQYIAYYSKHPEKEASDKLFRMEAGLLSKNALYYHKTAFEAARYYFSLVDTLVPRIKGKVNTVKSKPKPVNTSEEIKKIAMELGALHVGITSTKPYHFYSHKGRGSEYGKKINSNKHPYAIAFTVEMDQQMVNAAPKASIVMESARQYYNAGKIAVEIAEFIRNEGYDARAHIDGNYEMICPLVARDAGLGEMGRMGILMTPTHGPRVRIAVVSTEMRLIPDAYRKQHAMIDFCRMCKKCADCCPAKSISFNDPELIDNVKHWKINAESCYSFWCKAGTDCGRCMSVCPYSHPNSSFHKLIRWGIKYAKFFRYLAILLDDFFYGQKPKPKVLPEEQIEFFVLKP